jgi:hypothetical protein
MFTSILRGPPYVDSVEDSADGNGFRVTIPISHCNDSNRRTYILCDLIEITISGEIYWEFSFAVFVASLDESYETFQTQDREIARPFIPREARRFAMDAVCEALSALTAHVNPRKLYWVTKDRDPDQWALARHFRMRKTLKNQGYAVIEDGTDSFNRRFLTMARIRN